MRVLVTGGAGFIGSHIVDRLVEMGATVTVLDNLSTGSLSYVRKEAHFIKMDVRDEELSNLFARQHYDYVIHQAAQTMVNHSLAAPAFDCDVNIRGLVNLLEACRGSEVKRVVCASSAAVYGDVTSLPVTETCVPQPTSFYGLSKLTGEKYLHLYRRIFGLPYVALRYANVYGERQGDYGEGGVVSIFTRAVSRGDTVTVFGDGSQTRDFIYVGDVAAANCQALLTPHCDTVYNISTGRETSVCELLRLLRQISGRDVAVVHQPPRPGDIYRSVLDNRRAVAGLSWQPAVNMRDGLTLTYQALVKGAEV